jgi:nicotinamidase/pyrazinamidase
MAKTLIIIDLQNDFLKNGSLEVRGADEIVPIIHQLIPCFDHVIATQDWHPETHVSFAKTHQKNVGDTIPVRGRSQKLWPVHCVKKTHGAELAQGLDKKRIECIVQKGSDERFDSYSAFFDDGGVSTSLFEYLKQCHLFELYFVGLVAEYCVKASVLDALSLGFSVFVIPEALAFLELSIKKRQKTLEEMKKKGAKCISLKEILQRSLSNE